MGGKRPRKTVTFLSNAILLQKPCRISVRICFHYMATRQKIEQALRFMQRAGLIYAKRQFIINYKISAKYKEA